MNIFCTPIKIAITVIIFFILQSKKFYGNKWARIGRIIIIIFISLNILTWIETKFYRGHNQAHALFVSSFTRHISKLIEENKIEKAKETLAKFNAEYYSVADDNRKTEELVKKLIKESQ